MNEHKEYQSDKVDLRVWRRLIAYAMRRPRRVAGLGATLLVVSAIDILYPQLTRFAIDHFVEGHTAQGLGWFALLYVACVAVQGAGVFFFVRGAGRLEMDICYDIRQDAFTRLQQLSFSFYDTTSVGWLMARMGSDVARLAEMIAWSLVDLCWSGFFVVGIVAVLLSMDFALGLLVLSVTPLLAVLCVFFQRRILRQQRLVRAANSRITGAFNEGIMGAVTTKTLVREDASCEEFYALTGRHAPRGHPRRAVERAVYAHRCEPRQPVHGAGALGRRQNGAGRHAGAGHAVGVFELRHPAVRPHPAAGEHPGRDAGGAGLGRACDRPHRHAARHHRQPRGGGRVRHHPRAARGKLARHHRARGVSRRGLLLQNRRARARAL